MKKQIVLTIDTAVRDTIKVCLEIGGEKTLRDEIILNAKAQNALGLIEKIIHKNKLKLSDLTVVKVNKGPGSFIGLRIGVSVANTLAYLLDIQVNNQKPPVLPIYE